MVITTLLAAMVACFVWKWRWYWVLLLSLGFLVVDFSFFSANLLKIADGGWIPIGIATVVFTLMTTWKRGRRILADRLIETSMPVELFLSDLKKLAPTRISGTAVFMTGDPHGTPSALLQNIKHNKVLHERVVLLTIQTGEVPHIPLGDRLSLKSLRPDFFKILVTYGFKETPDMQKIMKYCDLKGFHIDLAETTFFVGRETLIPTKEQKGMAVWREKLFDFMARNSQSATKYFNIPVENVIEVGTQIEI